MLPAIKVEQLSKSYRLGLTHSRSIRDLVNGVASRVVKRVSRRVVSDHDSVRVDGEGRFWALKDVNFEIHAGEVVGIIGRNGAGKSTLLKILSRITPPTGGRIEMRGRVASLLEVGTGFHPELTGRENVYMNGTILGMTTQEITRRFDAIVDFAGVETFIDTPVKRYSSGMTVRLGFAVAAHLEPEILIVDEVLAVGDAQFQKKCMGKLDDVARSGRTVLFVSHNVAAIRQLTSRCVLIEGGRSAMVADTQTVLNRYMNESAERVSDPNQIAHMKRNSWAGDQSIKLVYAENLTPQIGHDCRIELKVGFTSAVFADFQIGLTLYSQTGDPVGAAFTELTRATAGSQIQWMEIDIRNPMLAPGRYWFTVGVLRSTRDLIDVVEEILHFEVSAAETLPHGINEWSTAWGQVRLSLETRTVDLVAAKR
jgi:lipopolysaccharide transport system ATP-binding protein